MFLISILYFSISSFKTLIISSFDLISSSNEWFSELNLSVTWPSLLNSMRDFVSALKQFFLYLNFCFTKLNHNLNQKNIYNFNASLQSRSLDFHMPWAKLKVIQRSIIPFDNQTTSFRRLRLVSSLLGLISQSQPSQMFLCWS